MMLTRSFRPAVLAWCITVAGCGLKGPPSHRAPDDGKAAAGPAEKCLEIPGPWAGETHRASTARKLEIGKCSLIGNIREYNEDAVAIRELPGATLCLAAHGMGGKVGERVLGQFTCARVFEILTWELKKDLPRATRQDENRNAIRRAMVTANEDIMALAGQDPDLRILGATVVLALWRQGDGIYIAGVGDNRAYLVRGDKIEQLTVDQTLAQALVEAKTITAEEARNHRFRHVLWKYVGTRELGNGPEVRLVRFQPGDRILLCTIGLHGVVSNQRIVDCMGQHAAAQACADALCQCAVDAGSRSNVSCIVIEMVDKNGIGEAETGSR